MSSYFESPTRWNFTISSNAFAFAVHLCHWHLEHRLHICRGFNREALISWEKCCSPIRFDDWPSWNAFHGYHFSGTKWEGKTLSEHHEEKAARTILTQVSKCRSFSPQTSGKASCIWSQGQAFCWRGLILLLYMTCLLLRGHDFTVVMVWFQALADPYFKGLAKVEREPSCQPITKLEFEFERRRATKEDIKELIFREILEYHPQLLKDYVNGTNERTNLLYPRFVFWKIYIDTTLSTLFYISKA